MFRLLFDVAPCKPCAYVLWCALLLCCTLLYESLWTRSMLLRVVAESEVVSVQVMRHSEQLSETGKNIGEFVPPSSYIASPLLHYLSRRNATMATRQVQVSCCVIFYVTSVLEGRGPNILRIALQ